VKSAASALCAPDACKDYGAIGQTRHNSVPPQVPFLPTTASQTLEKSSEMHSAVFMIWIGPAVLPPMYEAALLSAVKSYGRNNIVVVSENLIPAYGLYPHIWNVSALELASKLTDIYPLTVWESFISRFKLQAQKADFMRGPALPVWRIVR
jgi:hypothetical protein